MAEREQWPTDPEFRRFAAKVADAVMRATAEGWIIDPLRDPGVLRSCCPLGAAIPEKLRGSGYPVGFFAAGFMGVERGAECGLFIHGFDGRLTSNDSSPYFRLGRAYRRWALERAA